MQKLRIHGGQALLSIYRCKWVSGYSTAATTTSKTCKFMVDYLVNSLGFSEEQALVTSSKVSQLKSTRNPISIVNFFKSYGFDQTQIKTIVIKEPRVLSCKVEKTLKPKIKALTDIGLSGSDLARVLILRPEICHNMGLNEHIIPTIGLLKSVFDDNESLITAVKKSNWLLGSGVKKNLPQVVSLMKSYGLSDDQIKAFASNRPRYLASGAEVLQSLMVRVEERFGIPRHTPLFIHGLYSIGSLTEENLELRMGVYKSFGLTDEDILKLGRRNPYALRVSESKLRRALSFYMNVFGFQPAEIASMPNLLMLSFDKRVIPRCKIWQALHEKGIMTTRSSLTSGLTATEPKFFKRFVLPFKDQIPDLYNDYMKRVQSTTEVAK